MLDVEEISLSENQEIILRHLFMKNRYQTNSDIESGTDLEIHQVRYAINDLKSEQVNVVEVSEKETDGDIKNAEQFLLNDRGRMLVRNRDLKISKSTENSEQIAQLKEDIEAMRRDIAEIKQYCDSLGSEMESVVNTHRKELIDMKEKVEE